MRLPVILPDAKTQRFDCHCCTECCRHLVVHLTAADREKIDRQNWSGKLEAEPYIRLGNSFVLNHKPGSGCVFLLADGRCRIHAECGAAEKPLACQLYPFTLESEAAGFRVGIRFDCPSVARNEGQLLGGHRKDLGRLAYEFRQALPSEFSTAEPVVEIVPGRSLSAGEVDSLVEHVDAWLRDAARPVVDRLTGLCDLRDVLGEAKLSKLRGSQLRELFGLLAVDLPGAVQASRDAPPSAATGKQLKLLRHAVFAHCEHITLAQALAPRFQAIKHRLGQLGRSRRLAAGSEMIPPLVRGLAGAETVTFAALEAVRPGADWDAAACDDVLMRYVRVRLLSRSAFGKGYYGWPVLAGMGAIVLAVAVIGWLARYLAAAAGRPAYGREDVISAIGIVDRNAGRVPELGSRVAALRVRYLSADQGLLRLLSAYSLAPTPEDEDSEHAEGG